MKITPALDPSTNPELAEQLAAEMAEFMAPAAPAPARRLRLAPPLPPSVAQEAPPTLGEALAQALPSGVVPAPALARPAPPPLSPIDEYQLRRYRCPDCRKEHWAPHDAPSPRCPDCAQARVELTTRERRQRLHVEALGQLEDDFLDATFGPSLAQRVKPARAVRGVQQIAPLTYCAEEKRWSLLLLLGPTGAGKTTLGTAVWRWHLDKVLAASATVADEEFSKRCVWAKARDLAMARREERLGQEVKKLRRAQDATVLLVDDLGQEPADLKDDLVDLLSERQARHQPTIVTFGFALGADGAKAAEDPKSMANRYGDHFERRMTERAHVVRLGGGKQAHG